MHNTTRAAIVVTTAFLLACGSGDTEQGAEPAGAGEEDIDAAGGPLGGPTSAGHDPLGIGSITPEQMRELDASHCEIGETVWISCPDENDKTFSVCGRDDTLSYRFGKVGADLEIDLTGPITFAEDTVETPALVAVSYSAHATGDTHAVMFRNKGYRYEVMETWGGGDGFTGLMVYKDSKPQHAFATKPCGDGGFNHLTDNVEKHKPAE